MQTLTLDFETYYAQDYSLKSLGVLRYVRDPRFFAQGVGIKVEDQPTQWFPHTKIASALSAIDWANTLLVGHNLYFDATILFEHYGIVPARRCDTMSLARGLFPTGTSCGLDSVATLLGLGSKIKGSLVKVKGIKEPPPELLVELGEYCIQDVELTYQCYQTLAQHYHPKELDLIDLTLRMATEPVLEVDVPLSRLAYDHAVSSKAEAVRASGLPQSVLSSNKQFAELLTSLNIELPTKTSATTGEETEAFGKNDPEFIELMLSRPDLNHIWKGRLAVKSSLPETRAKRWIEVGTTGSKLLPMPLNYFGAHTGRFSGLEFNVQNLPRGGELRRAIRAPKGYVVHVRDSSQIELRVNAWLNGQQDVLDAVAEDRDLYKRLAAIRFGVKETAVTEDQRQFCKAVLLGCGFGMGATKFRRFCASGPLGMAPIYITEQDAMQTIAAYRSMNWAIAEGWKHLDRCIPIMATQGGHYDYKCVQFRHEHLILPNGVTLDYSGLHATENGWVYGIGKNIKNLWGGTLDENIVQALARIALTNQMLEVDALPNVRVVGFTHDEIISVIPEVEVEAADAEIAKIMSTSPDWAPDLPLASKGGWDYMYSK